MSLAYAECSLDIRESLAVQFFVDAIKDEETQLSTRLMDFTDLKSALAYSMKFEPAKRKLTSGRLAERKIPIPNKPSEEGLKVSALSGGGHGLYLEGSICDIPRLCLVDTGTNITLLRADLAHKVKERLIYTSLNLTLKIATGEKSKIRLKLDASIECGSRKLQHRVYVADITDSCILGLDFLQKFKFTLDLEKNEIRTGSEKISLFSVNTQHRKRTSDGTDVLSRGLCVEGCEPCSSPEKKFSMETDISVEALTMTTEDRWSLSKIQKPHLEDLDIRPILEKKLKWRIDHLGKKSLARVPQPNDVGLFGTPYILKMVFYIASGTVMMETFIDDN
ncbi:hypothetical protein AVEN_162945-1 [Araneus ventricosus]|uniref:Peptidase A2 domain-containing protein n=1 Tax=Araneus ventricosus TaxID=182803 RepID=A0A4Y2C012_ARAVE|nr:hypothetical protein AVEN_162945-1 [Araneus ventricosus]